MEPFDVLYPVILHNEGVSETNPTGKADIEGDPGGVTNWGISQRTWSRLYVQPQFVGFPSNVLDLTSDQAYIIYKTVFYKDTFDQLPLGAALIVFDCEVNQGIGIKVLQETLGVTPDGVFGPQTSQALRLACRNVPKLIEDLCWTRLKHYAAISKPDDATGNRKFLPTLWIPRLIYTRQKALSLLV